VELLGAAPSRMGVEEFVRLAGEVGKVGRHGDPPSLWDRFEMKCECSSVRDITG
jgi:hypothetical protein